MSVPVFAAALVIGAAVAALDTVAWDTDLWGEDDERIAFDFAPPIGTTLRYEITRMTQTGRGDIGARLVRDYRFERDPLGSGYLLWVELQSATALGDPEHAASLERLARPMVGVDYAVRIAADGTPIGLVDGEAALARIEQGHALLAEMQRGDDSEAGRQLSEYRDARQTLSTATREAELLSAIRDILALAKREVRKGEAPFYAAHSSSETGDFPVSGTIRSETVGRDLGTVRINSRGRASANLLIDESVSYRGSLSTGLVRVMERERVTTDSSAGDATGLVEHHRIHLLREMDV